MEDVPIFPEVFEKPATSHCVRCGETKPASEFYKDKKTKDGLHSYCKDCSKAKIREWRKSRVRQEQQERRDEFFGKLEGKTKPCEICGGSPTRLYQPKPRHKRRMCCENCIRRYTKLVQEGVV